MRYFLKISQLYQMCLFTAQHWKSNKLHLVPGCCGSTLNSKKRSTILTFNKVTLKSLGIVVHMFLRNIVSVLSFFLWENDLLSNFFCSRGQNLRCTWTEEALRGNKMRNLGGNLNNLRGNGERCSF